MTKDGNLDKPNETLVKNNLYYLFIIFAHSYFFIGKVFAYTRAVESIYFACVPDVCQKQTGIIPRIC